MAALNPFETQSWLSDGYITAIATSDSHDGYVMVDFLSDVLDPEEDWEQLEEVTTVMELDGDGDEIVAPDNLDDFDIEEEAEYDE